MKALILLALIATGLTACTSKRVQWEYKSVRANTDQAKYAEGLYQEWQRGETNGMKNSVKYQAYKNNDASRIMGSATISAPDYDFSKLGEEGWEMVASFVEDESVHVEDGLDGRRLDHPWVNTHPHSAVFIFKRQKQ